jgi:molybdopterin molybdotransferase
VLSVEDALARLVGAVGETDAERVPLVEALGRIPAADVVAAHDVPPFANSAMDGFAVRSSDEDAPRRIIAESRAGGPMPPALAAGTAVRIATGAPLPERADAVIPVEYAAEEDGFLRVDRAPERGSHVRAAGHDVGAGTRVEIPRAPLSAATIGLLAALGHAEVAVRRLPRVAILSTGDELVPVEVPLGPTNIHDSNGPALAAAVTEAGGTPLVLDPARDDADAIALRVADGARAADILVVSGGVSVGPHDHVRGAIERDGTLDFWRIAVQPGKPLAFGVVHGRPVVGLPGNPVSALVTFELFVRPMLRRMLGMAGDGRHHVRARVDETLGKDPSRRAYLRVRVCVDGPGYRAVSAGGQASSQLLPLASSNALLVVPEGVAATTPGEMYEAIVTGSVD